jgi:hypothetical protein
MKIMSSSSLPTSNRSPIVASRSMARYSPGLREGRSLRARNTVKRASARQIILNNDVSGVITSIPPNRVAFCGNMSTSPIAIASPNAAMAEQIADARSVVRPMARTMSAVTTTMASGAASLSNSK